MSRSSNTLKTSDVTTVPIQVKYFASYNTVSPAPLWSNVGITYQRGLNNTSSYYEMLASETSSFLNYRSAQQLYYSNYISGSIPTTASYADNWLQSTAASGTFDDDFRYFPTASNASIWTVSIPRSVYGQQIARKSFFMSGSTVDGMQVRDWEIIDDGNGNLIETGSGTVVGQKVGNIFYAQGMAVITSQAPEFGALMFESSYNTQLDLIAESTIYQNEVRCLVNENDFNYTLNPSALQSVLTVGQNCVNYTVTYVAGGGDLYFDYTDCSGTVVSISGISGGSQTFCAIEGSIVVYAGNYTITNNGLCAGSSPGSNIIITNGEYINEITGSDFDPYATTVGLYNDANELLVVGKLSRPYRMPPNTDITFIVRWDS
jgi:hypothetical protein